MAGIRVAIELLRNRDMRRVMLGLVAYALTEHGAWLAVMVYAYQQGGVRETGIVLFFLLVPSGIVAPLVATAADPNRPHRGLVRGFGIQTVSLAVTAAVMLTDAASVVVYGTAVLVSISLVITRPALAAVLPSMARTVEDLTAANATAGLIQTTGLFAGPALAAGMLALTSPGGVFAAAAVLMALATAITATARPSDGDMAEHLDEPRASGLVDGLRSVLSDGNSRPIVAVLTLIFLAVGALDVAFVAIVVELLGRAESTAGVLSAGMGLGAIAGAVSSLALVGSRRLTPTIAIGVMFVGIPIALISLTTSLAISVTLFVFSGAGRALADVAGRTMLQGMSSDETVARLFGVVEGMSMFALALGGLVFAGLAEWIGVSAALVVLGVSLPLAVGLRINRLIAIDEQRPEVDPQAVALMRSIPCFAPLPPYSIEQILAQLQTASFEPGQRILTEGDDGDDMFIMTEGTAAATLPDGTTATFEPGDYFGEIALLYNTKRNASVDAGPDGARAYTLDRDTYQNAVGTFARSHSRLAAVAQHRIEDTEQRS